MSIPTERAIEEPAAPDHENFRYLVRLLATNLRTKVAFICELTQDRQSARTLALSVDGHFLETFVYTVVGTPCEAVYRDGPLHVARELPQRFPDDQMLVDMRVDSYLGVPFFDSEGVVMGHVGIMNSEPIEEADARTALKGLLLDCAEKASAELQRLRAR